MGESGVRPAEVGEWRCPGGVSPGGRFEDAHRGLLLEEKVEQRLLAGACVGGCRAVFLATGVAFRVMGEAAGVNGDVSLLVDIGLAGLHWAGVDPAERSTWFIRAGGDR
jgi:hypothetical protein